MEISSNMTKLFLVYILFNLQSCINTKDLKNIAIYQCWVEVLEVWYERSGCAEWNGFPAEFGP